jgi:hypothetical protein
MFLNTVTAASDISNLNKSRLEPADHGRERCALAVRVPGRANRNRDEIEAALVPLFVLVFGDKIKTRRDFVSAADRDFEFRPLRDADRLLRAPRPARRSSPPGP